MEMRVFKSCSKCGKEFEVEMHENVFSFVATQQSCPYCNEFNHIWIKFMKENKSESKIDAIEKRLEKIEKEITPNFLSKGLDDIDY